MSPLEIAATILTLASVLLAVKRRIVQYPVGIVGAVLFFFVFQQARLYSSAALQLVFIAVQVYGWWFWLRGDRGGRPRITGLLPSPLPAAALAAVITLSVGAAAASLGAISSRVTGAEMAAPDAAIFGASVLAQFLLGRKKLETWVVWALVDAVAIPVYAAQGLGITAVLYAGLLFNTGWGYFEWRKEMRGLGPRQGDDDGRLSVELEP